MESESKEKNKDPSEDRSLTAAERQGFEPWVPSRVRRISSAVRSTTPASFLA